MVPELHLPASQLHKWARRRREIGGNVVFCFSLPHLLHLHDLFDPQCHKEPSLCPWRLRFNNFTVDNDQPVEVGHIGGRWRESHSHSSHQQVRQTSLLVCTMVTLRRQAPVLLLCGIHSALQNICVGYAQNMSKETPSAGGWSLLVNEYPGSLRSRLSIMKS